ncbi:hypothetical protein A5658_26600 [Mycobacterium sp. 1245111.1]|nr:hypothetical protein A5658_26600 [Mycobacterium sp. 1245111.1]
MAWPTDHLTEAASHWEAVGERSYGLAHGVWSDALGADWRGEAADALRTATHADMLSTSVVVDQLQDAATVARSGASELEAARSQIRYAVEDARSAGFQVGEDLSVTDRMVGGSAAERAARQAAAQAFAGQIGGRAAQLVSADAQVAARITAAVAGVGSTFPKVPSSNGQVHAVDNRTFKESPGKPPSPKGPSADDIRKVLEKLGKGSKPTYKTVTSPEDLQRLKQWMTEHGGAMETHYPEPDMGKWTRLPDGSEVGERVSADSTGKNVLDIDLPKPDGGTEYWKVHINPKTGEVPDIPAIGPAEAVPPEVASTEAGPVEGVAGGPAGIQPWPHLVHTPGSIDHGIPILGEDDPGEDARDFKH